MQLQDWFGKVVSQQIEAIAELDKAANETEFGDALLRLTAVHGVQTIVAGMFSADTLHNCALECMDCPMTRKSGATRPIKGKIPESLLDIRHAQTHCFSRDNAGNLLHLSCDPEVQHDLPDGERPLELLFPIMSSSGVYWGLAYFGAGLALDEESRQSLSFVANYAFARMLKIDQLGIRPRLSPRQREVLFWAAEGKTDSEIAKILDVSGHTVDKHMRQLKEALNATNRMSAIVLAMRYGLIS
jgi:LuxR family quorum sensing-dependent transcriptional regulator